jgi:two-component system, chemotaxis family, chemotaxis protein CheY
MRILIVEDDYISRRMLKEILKQYGTCDMVVDGAEAVLAFEVAWEEERPYDWICLDIMMPVMDGQEALRRIRLKEKELGVGGPGEVKVIMLTALGDPHSVVQAFYQGGATSYLVKPIEKDNLIREFYNLGLLSPPGGKVGRN